MLKRLPVLLSSVFGALVLAASTAAADPNTVGNFSYGQLPDQVGGGSAVGTTGCGTDAAAEPAIHVSPQDNLFLSSELGIGAGTDVWRGLGTVGGPGASGCALQFEGQPNTPVSGVGGAGGDTDLTISSAPVGSTYRVYVASLNLGSVAVAHSDDNGATWSNVPVQRGLVGDDREWIAAFGSATSLLTFHDIATDNIDVLRSDDGGSTYTQIAQAIPPTDYRASNNQHGNLVIDTHSTAGAVAASNGSPGFWAYQSFVAPSSSSGSNLNEAFLAVSNDGGYTWVDRPIPCSTAGSTTDLSHNFPDVSVGPGGDLWYAWSDDNQIHTAVSTDHGSTWSCATASSSTGHAIFPWLVATSGGEDLVYYETPDPTPSATSTWYVAFVQNRSTTGQSWGAPQQLMPVHRGTVCESGANCTSGRQLFDDFGVDTDSHGWAHIAYSQDAPALGGANSSTGYAVQTGGTAVGASASSAPGGLSAGSSSTGPSLGSGPGGTRCVDRTRPVSRITRLRTPGRQADVRGRASDRGCGARGRGRVRSVRVAIARRVGRRCRFVHANGHFGRIVSCRHAIWLRARGTSSWRLRLRHRLPPGRYAVWSRAVDASGNVERRMYRGNHRLFRIR